MLTNLKKVIGNRSPLRLAYHKCKSLLACILYRFPARKLTVIGITGTDGKTTTVGMTAHILHEEGFRVAALSTAFFRIKDKVEWNTTEKTSPNPFVIQKFLRKAVDSGCEHLVLEVSSHGLVQHRIDHTYPAVAAITNISMEHLDYHKTMDQYKKDKALLFTKHLKSNGIRVLNACDETYALLSADTKDQKVVAYGKASCVRETENSADAHIGSTDERTTNSGVEAAIRIEDGEASNHTLQMSVPGLFNIENAMCAIGCCVSVGVSKEAAVNHLRTFKNAPGRMESIDEGQDFSVYIDFTVTPAAFEKTLTTLNAMKKDGTRVLVLTGSCGDRMREKRPIIGKMCCENADVVVITDDEPYTEDPLKIIEEVWQGVDASCCEAHKILDREEAIEHIISLARPDDIVLLCGMGSYPSRWTAKGPVPWNEQEMARKYIRKHFTSDNG